MLKKLTGPLCLALCCLAAACLVSCGNKTPTDKPSASEPVAETNGIAPAALPVSPRVAAFLQAASGADFAALESLAAEAEKSGFIDESIAALEARAALTDSPPAVHIALSVLYGRKGFRTKEYAALAAAETAARQPNVVFNIALVHGRKKLLEGSPDADSFMVGNLSVESDPPGAALSLDGKPSGTTPVNLEKIKAGPHALAFVLDGFEPASLSAEIGVGSDTLFSKTLVSVNATGGTNRILNDSFEYDLQNEGGQWWELYCDEPKGNYGFARMDGHQATAGRQSLKITVSKLNGVLHEPHLKVIGLNVEKGKTYTYSVFMKADRPCRAILDIRRFRKEIFYGASPELSLGTEWKEYSYTIKAPESNNGDVMVMTQLGRDMANIWVDNARFYEGPYRKDDSP